MKSLIKNVNAAGLYKKNTKKSFSPNYAATYLLGKKITDWFETQKND